MKIGEINWFESVSVADMKHRSNCINQETFDRYDSSNLSGYKFVNQGIL
jgi:hypothetical protein